MRVFVGLSSMIRCIQSSYEPNTTAIRVGVYCAWQSGMSDFEHTHTHSGHALNIPQTVQTRCPSVTRRNFHGRQAKRAL